jgi:hypothetical protein
MSAQAARRSSASTSGKRGASDCSIVTCARRKSRPISGSASSRGELDLLVLDQPAHQFRARVLGLLAVLALARRQQHARLDLDEHGRHQQVLAGQLEVGLADLVDVGQVLARHVGQRNVQDVEVLLADQVQQQVQRTLEGLEEDLQRVRRDVQVGGHREQRLAVQASHGDGVDHRRRLRVGRGRRHVGHLGCQRFSAHGPLVW